MNSVYQETYIETDGYLPGEMLEDQKKDLYMLR